ncbi:hypothetical protein [Methylocystis iwaonis]|uniref:hypothetical protein n=1 Tax=Methylocystis iwaonis TaxID=2885079 RepID=UPI002E7C2585|nr:hypothetical protein [Methylocystis iwaonis]
MDLRKIKAVSKAASRKRMQEAGFYETTVFVHESTREAMDAAIARGQFKTRREAMEHAIRSAFCVEEGALKPR